jgi:hypothetical protein
MIPQQNVQTVSTALNDAAPVKTDAVQPSGKPAQRFAPESAGAKNPGATDATKFSGADAATATNGASSHGNQSSGQNGNQAGQHTQADSSQPAQVAAKATDGVIAQASTIANHAASHPPAANGSSDATRTNPQPAVAAASHGDVDERGSSSGINSAHVLQSMSESEMRVGMHSAEFGNISIRTSVSQQQMQAQISLDHSDLGQAIASHISSVQTKLTNEYGLHASIQVNHQGASSSGQSGDSQPREQRGFTPSARAERNTASTEPDVIVPAGALVGTSTSNRLDIQA